LLAVSALFRSGCCTCTIHLFFFSMCHPIVKTLDIPYAHLTLTLCMGLDVHTNRNTTRVSWNSARSCLIFGWLGTLVSRQKPRDTTPAVDHLPQAWFILSWPQPQMLHRTFLLLDPHNVTDSLQSSSMNSFAVSVRNQIVRRSISYLLKFS